MERFHSAEEMSFPTIRTEYNGAPAAFNRHNARLACDYDVEAKCRISLASRSVLSEYLTSENVQHSFGKLRVRGVQIRTVSEALWNHCEVKCDLGS